MTETHETSIPLAIAASENARRVRADDAAREKASTAELVEHWLKMAERATGLSREELEALSLSLPKPEPEPSIYRPPSPRRIARRWMQEAGAPELHIQNVCDADPVECDALAAVREFLGDPRRGLLVLSGGVGTRKTGSACWALSQRQAGMFVEADELLAIAFDDKPRYLGLKRAPLVVLDDLGTEIPDDKGHWHKTFNSLFNAWYANCAKVVITCNRTIQQFREPPERGGYGARVADRIRERGRWITLGGESVRGRA